jgi:hypothetical protein
MVAGNGSPDPPRLGKISPSSSTSSFPISEEDFFLDLNPTGNGDPSGIPVPDIIKEFSPIPDSRPKPHRESIPEPHCSRTWHIELFYFLLIGPIARPVGKQGRGMLSHTQTHKSDGDKFFLISISTGRDSSIPIP